MNGRTLILLVVAIVVAVATVMMVRNHTSGTETGPRILVAASDIAAGGFVHADKDVNWVDWPQASLSPAYITPDTHKIEEFNGAVARHALSAGEPITAGALVKANDGGFMSAVLTPGMRAVSIAVSLTTGNAGFIFPGDKVDLLLTHKIMGKDANDNMLASETFIEDVRVLAIDQMLDNPENKAMVAKTITLEVSPKQAEMINVAGSLGSISVSLRSLSLNAKASAGVASGPASKIPDNVSPAIRPLNVSAAMSKVAAPAPIAPAANGGNYSTDNDVSKLLGTKNNSAMSKVSVYHGSVTEQLDFHQGSK